MTVTGVKFMVLLKYKCYQSRASTSLINPWNSSEYIYIINENYSIKRACQQCFENLEEVLLEQKYTKMISFFLLSCENAKKRVR